MVYKINGLPSLTYSRFAKAQQNLSYSSLIRQLISFSAITPRFSPFWRRISHTPTERQRAVIAMEDHPAHLVPSFTQHAHLHDEMAAADGSVVLFANLLSEVSCTQAVLRSVRQPTIFTLRCLRMAFEASDGSLLLIMCRAKAVTTSRAAGTR